MKPNVMRIWHWLVGSSEEFTLPDRIFHSVCLVSLVALAYNVPLNLVVKLPFIALLSGISLLIFGVLYYYSRFKRKKTIAKLIFCILGNLLFATNYFLNSGIDGPTDLFFLMTVTLLVAIVEVRHYWIWVLVNLVFVLGLHYLQYFYPEKVPYTYANLGDKFFDLSSAYVVVMVLTLFTYYAIRKNYDMERASSEQKAAQMRVLNDEKNKLFSIIAHDLRAPLSNIQNYLELLIDVEMGHYEQQEIQAKLLESTRSTLDMLNNILLWSRNQMVGAGVKLGPIKLNSQLQLPLTLFKNIADNKNIGIHISIDPELEIEGNEAMFQLVIRNLVNNAIKFTANGGLIIITASIDKGRCIIMVKDSGNGKPVILTEKVFQLNSESSNGTANEKGIGLGLVLCKEFTEVQHGRIWFENAPKSGTCFFVEMPLSAQLNHRKIFGQSITAKAS
ncbi:sensor histidine kinase [Mucilaginibacter sp. KACC 22063]|uniref:sensor histidine kinase n=1 Tax=Mucilaginibacter sp. KACC 22063 TaxID=3025666 RepID=UPI002366E4FF|nr:HAMP domain-containing sensor histidine kinase [Mucilaginibacter sp. KACC 22063]WDF54295.1 HAMP domain-containing sensor histidine kinase [Mucilaginibacter sp. KACC 22063]